MHRTTLALVILAALTVAGFENAQMKRRKKKVKEASSFLKIPNFSSEEQQCAACEAVAQSLESQMRLDKHRGGYVEQMAALLASCDDIDTKYFPAELPAPKSGDNDALEEAGAKVLHFVTSKKEHMKEIEQKYVSVGLGEFCTSLIEEFEDEMMGVIAEAKPISSEMQQIMGGKSDLGLRYELKEQVCVQATKSCPSAALNRISQARIGHGMGNMDKDAQAKILELMKASMKSKLADAGESDESLTDLEAAKAAKDMPKMKMPAGEEQSIEDVEEEAKEEPKVEAPPKAKKAKTDGKKWKGKTKQKKVKGGGLPSNPIEAFEWLKETTAAKPYHVLASVVSTTAVVYVGGMVARIW